MMSEHKPDFLTETQTDLPQNTSKRGRKKKLQNITDIEQNIRELELKLAEQHKKLDAIKQQEKVEKLNKISALIEKFELFNLPIAMLESEFLMISKKHHQALNLAK